MLKNSHKTIIASAVAVIALSSTHYGSRAEPISSPSVRTAARLKNAPPAGWIRHYLPDDRYKISGGIWKFVSTEHSAYYHLPNSSFMMHQPAGSVIGFSSAADAEDAGYLPGPSIVDGGQRIVLADGVSSLVLPPNWQRLENRKGQPGTDGFNASSDLFQPLRFRGTTLGVIVSTTAWPGHDFGNGVDAATLKRRRKAATHNGAPTWDRPGHAMVDVRIGGMRALKTTTQSGASESGGTVDITAFRGAKMYSFQMAYRLEAEPGLSTMMRTFRPGK